MDCVEYNPLINGENPFDFLYFFYCVNCLLKMNNNQPRTISQYKSNLIQDGIPMNDTKEHGNNALSNEVPDGRFLHNCSELEKDNSEKKYIITSTVLECNVDSSTSNKKRMTDTGLNSYNLSDHSQPITFLEDNLSLIKQHKIHKAGVNNLSPKNSIVGTTKRKIEQLSIDAVIDLT